MPNACLVSGLSIGQLEIVLDCAIEETGLFGARLKNAAIAIQDHRERHEREDRVEKARVEPPENRRFTDPVAGVRCQARIARSNPPNDLSTRTSWAIRHRAGPLSHNEEQHNDHQIPRQQHETYPFRNRATMMDAMVRSLGVEQRELARIETGDEGRAGSRKGAVRGAGARRSGSASRTCGRASRRWCAPNRDALTGGGKTKPPTEQRDGARGGSVHPRYAAGVGRSRGVVAENHGKPVSSRQTNARQGGRRKHPRQSPTSALVCHRQRGEDFIIEPFDGDLAKEAA